MLLACMCMYTYMTYTHIHVYTYVRIIIVKRLSAWEGWRQDGGRKVLQTISVKHKEREINKLCTIPKEHLLQPMTQSILVYCSLLKSYLLSHVNYVLWVPLWHNHAFDTDLSSSVIIPSAVLSPLLLPSPLASSFFYFHFLFSHLYYL